MIKNTNNNSDQVDIQLYDEPHKKLLYELLLYKKKDIIAIQKNSVGPINDNTNQTALNQSKKEKTLEDLFGLLFNLVKELRPIQKELDISSHPHPYNIMSKYTRSCESNIWRNVT
ncbi:hypothetical protein C1645_840038 [Glomus cerebriforme]|uniref:Uncharacterized protein n=1 Tax=Glomus cerebriforme TaxID=658196 RepID=A0A397S6W6_9GLOM|nr:hypothetical protein C1645_840038 [Glomus cerebriforme]